MARALGLGLGLPFRGRPIGGGGAPVDPTLPLDLDFRTGTLDPRVTFTRAGLATYTDSAGVLSTAATNIPRFDHDPATLAPRGLLLEEQRINVVLWNRDLTNAAWVKTNVTAAKNQVGVDGVAASASSLTATAANATCLQAITLGSSARYQSAHVKRLTGSGVINMTMNGGTTWTPITVTANWTRVEVPTATLANPSVGFRLVTSGDAVAVDYVQNENGAFATSAITTTTAAVTRAADAATMTGANFSSWYNTGEGTFVLEMSSALITQTQHHFNVFSDATNRLYMYTSATPVPTFTVILGTPHVNNITAGAVSATPDTVFKFAAALKLNDVAICTNGGAITSDTVVSLPTTVNTLALGRSDTGTFPAARSHMRRLTYYNVRKSNAELQVLTAL